MRVFFISPAFCLINGKIFVQIYHSYLRILAINKNEFFLVEMHLHALNNFLDFSQVKKEN